VGTIAPTVVTYTPARNSTVTNPTQLVLTFSENVNKDILGELTIINDSDSTIAQVISMNSSAVLTSYLSPVVTFNINPLLDGKQYRIQITNRAIYSYASVWYAGI
ncbi:MAG: Ig-like domain-containing protein, partial [bacterium]